MQEARNEKRDWDRQFDRYPDEIKARFLEERRAQPSQESPVEFKTLRAAREAGFRGLPWGHYLIHSSKIAIVKGKRLYKGTVKGVSLNMLKRCGLRPREGEEPFTSVGTRIFGKYKYYDVYGLDQCEEVSGVRQDG